MRIIAGKHKGRNIVLPKNSLARPTTAKTREGIFSILSSGNFLKNGVSVIYQAKILELFCGSGAWSFEALSRGAAHAIVVDEHQENLDNIKQTAQKLSELNNISLIRGDACFLPKAYNRVDIVYMDPPYNTNLVDKVLLRLRQQDWLKHDTIIIIEMSSREDLNISADFNIINQRNYGKTRIVFLVAVNNALQ